MDKPGDKTIQLLFRTGEESPRQISARDYRPEQRASIAASRRVQ